MARPEIALLVTDVDNTLFDWVSSWATCAPYLVESVSVHLGIDHAEAEHVIRAVHREWGMTECPSCVRQIIPDAQARNAIIHGYEMRFARTSAVFGDVPFTLQSIRSKGARVAAYTESHRQYTRRRLELLGLAGLIDELYSDQRKPDPSTLHRIATANGVEPEHVLYVGDNLWKDVAMAECAGLRAAWARYGTHRDAEARALLNRLCHWTPADVDAEREAASTISARIVLEQGLAELLDLFTFIPHD